MYLQQKQYRTYIGVRYIMITVCGYYIRWLYTDHDDTFRMFIVKDSPVRVIMGTCWGFPNK